jgi:nucleoside-triphosphatase
MNPVIFLTGRPGIGKTTLVRRVVERLSGQAGGFYTVEMRQGGIRQGFKLVTLDGQERVFAQVGFSSPYHIGKYGVEIAALDAVGVPAIDRAVSISYLVVIDEIGPMELFSAAFRAAVLRALDSGRSVLATVAQRAHPWINAIKRRSGVTVIHVTLANRDELVSTLVETFQKTELSQYTDLSGRTSESG